VIITKGVLMKKIFLLFILLVLMCGTVAYAGNLYAKFKDYDKIRVFLKDIRNESGDKRVDIDGFRRVFKEVLEGRKNVSFVSVNNKSDADVIMTVNVKGYMFKEKVLPRFFSAYSLAADATAPKNLAKIIVDYTINDSSGNELTSFNNFTTEERLPRKKSNGDEAYLAVVRKNVNRLLFRTFYEQRSRKL